MKKISATLFILTLTITMGWAQTPPTVSPCSADQILARNAAGLTEALQEDQQNEAFIQAFIESLHSPEGPATPQPATYTIPIVLHVFHLGDDGKIDMEQVQSGLEILNDDFNGLNDGWNSIDPDFDGIKGTLDIEFCLASIDPEGKPTTGVLYYEDEEAINNEGDLFQYAWNNYKYLNIYLPKYVFGGPSNFTAYAYYPSTANSNQNRDGIFYSSIRWGYGTHSELSPGQDWASVISHEAGHWLDLRHTFENGCSSPGDLVDDTPYTLGGSIELSGCDNNDMSCGQSTNGENFMDYNHDCKKMFTQGQVERMIAALNLPSRAPLWSTSNLQATGCALPTHTTELGQSQPTLVYPNPAQEWVNFQFDQAPETFSIYDLHGKLMYTSTHPQAVITLNTGQILPGMYYYTAIFGQEKLNGKFVVE